MNADEILDRVCRTIDILVAAGDRHEGLFPSLLNRETDRMLQTLPPAVEGQRDGDRSHQGSNLIHDQAVIKTMYAIGRGLGRPDYTTAADRYLRRFATHCTDTETGLFPWGEHAYWHLVEDRVANSYLLRDPARQTKTTHDHLRQAPLWLWEKLYEYNPRCVERFAQGLNGHWTEGDPPEYIRHAYIEEIAPYRRGPRSCDFPRHSGFYIFDWTFAYLKTGRRGFLEQIERMLDYWWPKRNRSGLLLGESRWPPEEDTPGKRRGSPTQTLSLGVSLLETAALMEGKEPALAEQMRERGAVYIGGFLSSSCEPPIWGSRYGNWPASYVGLIALCGHRLQENGGLFRWAREAGQAYLETSFPEGVPVPAMDAGMGLGLLADLYDLTGEADWLAGGTALAERLIGIYMDRDLPRGAAGIDWYESQMGPSFLIHGLARIALMAKEGRPCVLEADYTAR